MKTNLTKTPLKDLVVLDIEYFEDERGFFIESWNQRDFKEAGLDLQFVQDSHSRSRKGVLRGLHYQDMTAPMGKLVRCTAGRVFDVSVDLRTESRTLGKWFGIELTADNKKLVYVPVGFAHGFVTLSEAAEIQYKQTGFYTPAAEGSLRWDDGELGIEWPISKPILSNRDQTAMSFAEYRQDPAF
jgi:dTDP-4-dehydrorhamnose 3,5-epimerase